MINLASKNIIDISPLSSLLSLRSVWLENNKIKDIRPLSSLHNLAFLSLTKNEIEVAHHLEYLKHLRWIFLGFNKIKDTSFLKKLTELRFLDIQHNAIDDYQNILLSSEKLFIVFKGNPFIKDFCLHSQLPPHNKYVHHIRFKNLCENANVGKHTPHLMQKNISLQHPFFSEQQNI
jgi:Leucine-rich repeat (LRR) protein